MPNVDVEVHAAAFTIALLRAGLLDQAVSFTEWYVDELGGAGADRLESLVQEAM